MKLLFITDHLAPYPGGISVYSESIIPRLRKAGVDVTIFGPRGSKTADFALPTIILVPKVTKANYLFCLPSYKLLKAIATKKYDLIHINSPLALFSIPVYIMAKFKKVKVVCANHGNIALYCKYNLRSSFFSKIFTFLGGTVTYLPQLLFRPTILQNPGCSDLQKFYKNKIKSLSIKAMICGIDLDFFEFSPTYEEYKLISIGRLSPEKNWLRLLELFTHLPKRYKLEIMGSGGQEAELKAYCKKHNLNVHFLGEVPHHQVGTYLRTAQAYICASLFETWGLTLTESLSCGTPIVYPHCNPFTELYGKDFPKGGYELTDGQDFVRSVLETENTTAEMRATCNTFAKQFSWENATNHLMSIYTDVHASN